MQASLEGAERGWMLNLVSRPNFASKEPRKVGLEASALSNRLAGLARSDPALFLERYGRQSNSCTFGDPCASKLSQYDALIQYDTLDGSPPSLFAILCLSSLSS